MPSLQRIDAVADLGRRLPPIAVALFAQLMSLAVCAAIAWLARRAGLTVSLGAALLLQSAAVVGISHGLRMRPWWLPIQAAFLPTLLLAQRWALAPNWYLAGFLLLALIFWSTFRTQVPLYLSRRAVWDAVAAHLPQRAGLKGIDLGAGVGGWVRDLAARRPDGTWVGIESAPLPCLIAWLRTLARPNAHLRWGDFWRHDLGAYDVVFAYLSPVPMPELWEKARREMRPGSLFISYRFAVPGVAPTAVVPLADFGCTQLYLWRM